MLSATRGSISRRAQLHLRPSPLSQTQRQSAFARLLSSLAVLEQREGRLDKASLSAVSAAQKLGGPVTGFIAGSNTKLVAEEAAKINGLEKVIIIENGSYDKVRPHMASSILSAELI
jgi:electron transfer flavoprotein alpha subunit